MFQKIRQIIYQYRRRRCIAKLRERFLFLGHDLSELSDGQIEQKAIKLAGEIGKSPNMNSKKLFKEVNRLRQMELDQLKRTGRSC